MNRKQSNKKIELLAPAGDLKRCKLAIDFGADAVYLGGQHYSLRSRASNFTMEDIKEACRYAKERGARIHVTVNVIPHQEDFEGLAAYLKQLEEYGVTAVIVASVAIMKLAKKVAPKLEVHCSTQMSITNAMVGEFLASEIGIDRVVLARECTLQQVEQITKACPVETEAFVHGGMCVNVSGRCTLSNRMTLRDANRGGCAQSCRWEYRLFENDQMIQDPNQMFTMGSKDLNAVSYVQDLIRAGVSSLKIEGRMKTEYYVCSIVSAYRHLIDDIYAHDCNLPKERIAYHQQEIMKGENRQVCDGFYPEVAGHSSIIYTNYSNATVNHSFLGVILDFDETTMLAKLQVRNAFSCDETLEVLSPKVENRSFQCTKIINDKGVEVESIRNPMAIVQVQMPFVVQANDILRRSE